MRRPGGRWLLGLLVASGCQSPPPVETTLAPDASALPGAAESATEQHGELVWQPGSSGEPPAAVAKTPPKAVKPAAKAPAPRVEREVEVAAGGRPAPSRPEPGGRPTAAPESGRPAPVPSSAGTTSGRPTAVPAPPAPPPAAPKPIAPPPAPPPPPPPVATTAAEPTRDDLRTRLDAAGAKTGDIQISLAWNNKNDLDLHVRPPCGTEIFFSKKKACGGVLDIDRNVMPWTATSKAIENVYFAGGAAAPGTYTVSVKHFNNRGPHEPTRFLIRVKRGAETIWKEGTVMPRKKVSVVTFNWP